MLVINVKWIDKKISINDRINKNNNKYSIDK
jgi:hypothetical protein